MCISLKVLMTLLTVCIFCCQFIVCISWKFLPRASDSLGASSHIKDVQRQAGPGRLPGTSCHAQPPAQPLTAPIAEFPCRCCLSLLYALHPTSSVSIWASYPIPASSHTLQEPHPAGMGTARICGRPHEGRIYPKGTGGLSTGSLSLICIGLYPSCKVPVAAQASPADLWWEVAAEH